MKSNNITLLDGSSWDVNELIKRMSDDTFYYGYMGKASLSSSSVKMLADSPKVYNYYLNGQEIEGAALDVGALVHHLILEPHKIDDNYIIVDTSSRQTNVFKGAKAESNKTTITRKEYEQANRAATAALKNPVVQEIMKDCTAEVPIVGRIYDLPFRAKADLISASGEYLYDIKTTSDVKSFRKSAFLYSYNAQAYIYCTLFNINPANFKYIVVDKGSYDIGVFTLSDEFISSGRELTVKALNNYQEYFVRGVDLNNFTIQETL